MSTTAPTKKRLTECRHAHRGSGKSCLDWPSPDSLGRVHCTRCGCFTAAPDAVHSWCRPRPVPGGSR